MKIGVALALVIAFPTVAAAQYAFQLRPSPYRILSGWEQGVTARGQTVQPVTRAVTAVNDHAQAGRIDARQAVGDSDVTGGINSTQAPRY
mgnify:CR=1 FL=1